MNANAAIEPNGAVSPAVQFQRDLVALIPNLRAFSRLLCSGKAIAEDMAQEALAKAWRARASFAPGTNLKAWLFTILRNEIYSNARRAWRETHWDPEEGERLPSPPDEQEWRMNLGDTARALNTLPLGQREALVLVGAGGFSYEEAASITNTALGTVKSRVARGRIALMDILDNEKPLPARRAAGSSHEHLAPIDSGAPGRT